MTENEAKTKWCPFAAARVVKWDKAHDTVVNTVWTDAVGGNPTTACIASACMAWRWKYEQTNKQPLGGMSWPEAEPIYRQTESGGCGLAGAPR